YLGSWGALIGAERLGARVFPFGAGATGQTVRAVQWIQQMRPTVLYGTPSYSLRLAEVAAENHVDPASFGLRRLFFSGEPGASVPAIRTRIEELYAAEVFDCGSMAEVSPWMALAETTGHVGMLAWQDLVYAEVCDPVRFTRLPYGGEGTPVYTTLERTSQPMIRLVSNDLTKWEAPSSPCGRTYPVFPHGIYGRIDDMFTIRGENIYPSAIDDVVMGEAGYGGEHRIIISRSESMDELTVQVEYDNEVAAADATGATRWAIRLSERLRSTLGVRTTVVPVPPYTLERTEFKARRVIDDREMFRAVRAEAAESASDTTSLR
ncbi:MAG: phenylacetate--CoA ligase family protein, partial [Pseudonocardiaceae bacterium]